MLEAIRRKAAAKLRRATALTVAGSLFLGTALPLPAAAAPEQVAESLEGEVQRLRSQVVELEANRKRDLDQMEEMRATLEALQAQMARVSALRQPGRDEPEPEPEEKVGTVKERASKYSAERDILEQRGGVLLPGGQLVLEPGFEYTNIQSNRLDLLGFAVFPSILVGRIESVDIDRDIYRSFIQTRYGITDRLEVALDVPYLYRSDKETAREGNDFRRLRIDNDGIGDIEFALLGHVIRERGWIPDTILNFRVRAPTGEDPYDIDRDENGVATESALGTGHWGLRPGVTFVKAFDPAVMFASLSYQWNLERSPSGFGDIDPGDLFEYDLGLAFALNPRTALSFSLSQRILGRTKVNGDKVDLSDVNAASLFIGMSQTINSLVGANVSVGFGVTDDAPDFQIQVRTPLRFPKRFPVPNLPSIPWFGGGKKQTAKKVMLDDGSHLSQTIGRSITKPDEPS